MDGDTDTITLPEITIEGSADAPSVNESDWWCNGFVAGFNAPGAAAERPLMIDDELASWFFAGVESGQNSRSEMQAELEELVRDSPQLGPDLGGEPFEQVQRRFEEQWEAVFHQHMPHTEIEGEPGPTLVRPNIVIIPE